MVLILAALALALLKPFIPTILTAIVISYISYPLYNWLSNKLHKKTISAFVTLFVVLLIITVPTIFAVNALSKEIFAGYLVAKQYLATGAQTVSCQGNFMCGIMKSIGLSDPGVANFISDSLGKATALIFGALTNYILALPKTLANIFIAIFLTYYLLKDGKQLVSYAKRIIPLKSTRQEMLIKRLNDVTYAVVYGNVIVAVIQGILLSIGFFIFGVGSPLIWGVVTAFTSLIPFLGAFVVWLPASLFLIISGYSSGDGVTLLKGVGLMLYGFIFVSSIDNILKPKIIGDRAKLHPALVLLGVISGLAALGIVGVIVGPVLIALAATVIQLVSRNRNSNSHSQ
ncbi:AI-2E family transporter [Candidatus Woesearchaeota archaeon]|nr:AI-2E family transporter [Candidatus Woesearchaeota archaeon]